MNRKTSLLRAVLTLTLLAAAQRGAAHDFWIEPSTFRPAVGEAVTTSLRVGERFSGTPIGRSANMIRSFVVKDGSGERPVLGEEALDPAGVFEARARGAVIVGYHSRPQPISLPAAKFEAYLREEGLEHVIAARRKRGDSSSVGRERFSRFAKSLLFCESGTGAFAQPLGMTLEIVPAANPYTATGDVLPVRLLYRAKPLAGALLVAINRNDPSLGSSIRSDANGMAALRLPASGVWLVKAVHAVPAPAGANADWDTLWASLTFEWRGGSARGAESGEVSARRY